MGKPAARVTDMHTCPMVTGVVPHVGGPILPPAAPTVLTVNLPQARVTDMLTCVGPPDVITMGSFTVLTQGLPSARMGDMTAHGGVIVMGAPNVLIGDAGFGTVTAGMFKRLAPLIGLEGASANVAQMVQGMIAAAKDGKPFCEQCTVSAMGG